MFVCVATASRANESMQTKNGEDPISSQGTAMKYRVVSSSCSSAYCAYVFFILDHSRIVDLVMPR